MDFEELGAQITETYAAGMRAERAHWLRTLAPIFAAMDRAADDPDAKIPSHLMAAVEAARVSVKDITG